MSIVSPQSAAAAPSPVLGNLPPGDGMPGGPMPPGFFQVSLCAAPLITGVHRPSDSESQTTGYRLHLPSLLFTPKHTCTHTCHPFWAGTHRGAIMPAPLVIRQAPGVLRESVWLRPLGTNGSHRWSTLASQSRITITMLPVRGERSHAAIAQMCLCQLPRRCSSI